MEWKGNLFMGKNIRGHFFKCNKKIILIILIVFALCFVIADNKVSANAKENVYYFANHIKMKDKNKKGIVRKILVKKTKLVTVGSFIKKTNYADDNYIFCKSKRRVFKLAKGVKFYSSGGTAGKQRCGKKTIRSLSVNGR